MSLDMSIRKPTKVSMKMLIKMFILFLMTMMMLITIDDDHDGHDDDVFLAGWGSFEASFFLIFLVEATFFPNRGGTPRRVLILVQREGYTETHTQSVKRPGGQTAAGRNSNCTFVRVFP